MTRSSLVLIGVAALAACGGTTLGSPSDGGTRDGVASSGSSSGGSGSSSGSATIPDGSVQYADGGASFDATAQDGGSGIDSAAGQDAGPTGTGGGPVDAGYYHGDGSYWVDGGAYSGTSDAGEPATDAGVLDASPGCSALATCCASLTGGLQTLCDSIAESGNASNCATELAQLQGEGDCTGVTTLASEVQVPPDLLVSDGTLLFWTTKETPGLLAMPVGGGPITILLDAPISNSFGIINGASASFLAVDDANVYVLQDNGLLRIPKNGDPAALVNESGASVINATILGTTAYWVEARGGPYSASIAVLSAPLLGGPVSLLGNLDTQANYPISIGVTSSTVFLSGNAGSNLAFFPIATGVPVGGPTASTPDCTYLASDTSAVYCAPSATGSNLAIASNGTASTIGPAVSSSTIAFDDTYAYWVDMTTVGAIMKAPKTGGGNATVLANDTSPTAIAVDASSVYWSDADGYIKSISK